jgi:hypothetical protein
MPNTGKLLKLSAMVLLTLFCSLLGKGTATANSTNGCAGDPTGNFMMCCERAGYIFTSCNGVCCCIDDYGNRLNICGG